MMISSDDGRSWFVASAGDAMPEVIYDYDDELKGGAHEACRYDL